MDLGSPRDYSAVFWITAAASALAALTIWLASTPSLDPELLYMSLLAATSAMGVALTIVRWLDRGRENLPRRTALRLSQAAAIGGGIVSIMAVAYISSASPLAVALSVVSLVLVVPLFVMVLWADRIPARVGDGFGLLGATLIALGAGVVFRDYSGTNELLPWFTGPALLQAVLTLIATYLLYLAYARKR